VIDPRAGTGRERAELLLVLLLAVGWRIPFWSEALRTPLDGDEARIGLMARHLGEAGTIWGQPFGSPLESVLAWPFVAVLGPTVAALRIPYFILGVLLVPITYQLAAVANRRAALPAALLMACPSPYLLIIGSLSTTYPITLVLCGLLLLLTLWLAERLADSPARAGLAAWGGLAGLAIWTHLMSASVVAASWAYLLLRSRRRAATVLIPAAMILVLTAPWWSQGLGQALRIVRFSRPGEPMATHPARFVAELVTASGGLVGAWTPRIADDPRELLVAPRWIALFLVVAYALLLAHAARAGRGTPVIGLLLAVLALVLLAFPLPQRSKPHTVRHLTAAYVPLIALAGFAAASFQRRAATWVAVSGVVAVNLVGGARLLGAWRSMDRSAPPFSLPDLAPVIEALEARGVHHAYASYAPAYRLTYESGERIIASSPWNERFRHYPLPYLDEVRFAKGVAWVLTPVVPSDLPAPEQFEALMRAIGGRWSRTEVGPAVIYDRFVPPVSPIVEPLPFQGAGGEASRAVTRDPGQALTLTLAAPTELDGVTLLEPSEGASLPRDMDVAVSADGALFEGVLSRRRLEDRERLFWVNGHPQYVTGRDAILIPLGGRRVAAVRIMPVGPGEPWALGELLLHPSGAREAAQGWSEWLDPALSWKERVRVLAANPLRDRADWHYRMVLSQRVLRSGRSGP
jgi:hypothetical protein